MSFPFMWIMFTFSMQLYSSTPNIPLVQCVSTALSHSNFTSAETPSTIFMNVHDLPPNLCHSDHHLDDEEERNVSDSTDTTSYSLGGRQIIQVIEEMDQIGNDREDDDEAEEEEEELYDEEHESTESVVVLSGGVSGDGDANGDGGDTVQLLEDMGFSQSYISMALSK